MRDSRVRLKRDPMLLVLHVALILCATYLLAKHVITLRELAGFLGGSAFVPAVLGLASPRDARTESPSRCDETSKGGAPDGT